MLYSRVRASFLASSVIVLTTIAIVSVSASDSVTATFLVFSRYSERLPIDLEPYLLPKISSDLRLPESHLERIFSLTKPLVLRNFLYAVIGSL